MNFIHRHYIVLSRYIHYRDSMAIKYRISDSSTNVYRSGRSQESCPMMTVESNNY